VNGQAGKHEWRTGIFNYETHENREKGEMLANDRSFHFAKGKMG
jgi:hypothetical protein